jgi:hypothetical protein
MHPTVDEQLRGVRRLLDGVVEADGGLLSARSAAALDDARRIVRRLEWSWSLVLPFLDWDNRATEALLAELAALVPAAVPAGSTPTAAAATQAPAAAHPPELHFALAHERNLALRARLTAVVANLPEGAPAPAPEARALIAAHLRRRLETDPANRRAPATATAGHDGGERR